MPGHRDSGGGRIQLQLLAARAAWIIEYVLRSGRICEMKTYAIHWKSSVTGTIGTGTKLFEKEAAERLATELNEQFPDIDHQAVIPMPPAHEPADPNQLSPQAVEG